MQAAVWLWQHHDQACIDVVPSSLPVVQKCQHGLYRNDVFQGDRLHFFLPHG